MSGSGSRGPVAVGFRHQRKNWPGAPSQRVRHRSPLWTPDGKRIIFKARVGNESVSMWWMAADGTGVPERLATSRNPQLATSVSPDGSHLVYHEATPDSSLDILQMTLDGTHQITPLLQSAG